MRPSTAPRVAQLLVTADACQTTPSTCSAHALRQIQRVQLSLSGGRRSKQVATCNRSPTVPPALRRASSRGEGRQ
ncbi:hypothetical protein NDU88_004622 [Pleurodeles waltl]|uniref:Uncharacterized protein n=1 Tax=Pleurodeles waltl TaxID=8319 RepID=A0AAV7VKD6_PLEWA|nr:hypothetical protein NDU88_004622 [Pleurodeles waltl]